MFQPNSAWNDFLTQLNFLKTCVDQFAPSLSLPWSNLFIYFIRKGLHVLGKM